MRWKHWSLQRQISMSTKLKPAVNDEDHIQGRQGAVIELVEYGDYQCPHCGRAYPILKQIQREMGDDLKLIFRNFPLAESHPDAVNAAISAEASALQGKFWEMHDILFEHQDRLGIVDLFAYAKQVGLSLEQFKEDIQKESLAARVDQDIESGIRSGVNGTPSFFLNGEKYEGSWERREFVGFLKRMKN